MLTSLVARRDEDVDVEDAPQEAPGYGCVIFVANLPVVPPEKYDKLVTVVRKIYSQIGTVREGASCAARRAAPAAPAPSSAARRSPPPRA